MAEREDWFSDGSRDIQVENLTGMVKDQARQLVEHQRREEMAIRILDRMISNHPDFYTTTELSERHRELRMVLSGGMALTKTYRADSLVKEWMKDPDRDVFGLAADLLDVISKETPR